MQPTSKLRFVKRKVKVGPITGTPYQYNEIRVLQQYWVPHAYNLGWCEIQVDGGEWRDVECFDEEPL